MTKDEAKNVEEVNSNRVFNSQINTTTTLDQEAHRRRLAALNEESQSKLAVASTEVADGSLWNHRSEGSGRGLFPIQEKDCLASETHGQAALSGDALEFTIGRNTPTGMNSQPPSRNADLMTAQFQGGESDKARHKPLTLSGEHMRSHARKRPSPGSTPGSGGQAANNPSPEWQPTAKAKEIEAAAKREAYKRSIKRNKTEEGRGEGADPFSMTLKFNTIAQQTTPKQVPPKNVTIPKFKLPLDKLNEPIAVAAPKATLVKSSTTGNLPNEDYYGGDALYKLKIRKNFRRIQIKNSS